jgi:putative intracellular protease/amidase
MSRLLMVVTGADHLTLKDGSIRKTGFWAEELVVPHELFRGAGVVVEIATPGGVEAPLDQESLAPAMNPGGSKVIEHYKEYLASIGDDLKHPRVLEELSGDQVDAYDAIFLPGGHGPMQDLAHSKPLGEIIRHMQARDKLVVAVCHGPAGLLPALGADGTWAFQGFRLTAFTNEEEEAVGLADKVPFLLETRLRELGGDFQPGKPWKPHVVADRNLATGQNPASSAGVAREALARLGAAVHQCGPGVSL